jgi:hypothetical protein
VKLVKGLRKFKARCGSDVTKEIGLEGLRGTFGLRGTGSFGGLHRR